jgi:CBS domain-containing protein
MIRYVENFAKPVLTAAPDDSLASVASTLEQHNVGAVVILEHRRPVGILTDRDLALALALHGATPRTPVVRVMTTPVETVAAGAGVFQATQAMREYHVRRLAVVDDEGELVGIVTLDDLLRLLSRELSNLAEGIAPEMQVR